MSYFVVYTTVKKLFMCHINIKAAAKNVLQFLSTVGYGVQIFSHCITKVQCGLCVSHVKKSVIYYKTQIEPLRILKQHGFQWETCKRNKHNLNRVYTVRKNLGRRYEYEEQYTMNYMKVINWK